MRTCALGLWLVGVAGMLAGCPEPGGEGSITFYVPGFGDDPEAPMPPIAVGARAPVTFYGGIEYGYYNRLREVRVQTLTFRPEGLVTWQADDVTGTTQGWLTALGPGTVTVDITGTVDDAAGTGTVTVQLREPARARYALKTIGATYHTMSCASGRTLVARPGETLRGLYQELFDAQSTLLAGEGVLPSLAGGTVETDTQTGTVLGSQPLVITFPTAEGTVDLVPPAGATGVTFEVTGDTTITGLDGASEVEQGGGRAEITLFTEIGSAADCYFEGVPVTGTVITTDTCAFVADDPATMAVSSFDETILVDAVPGAASFDCTVRFETALGAPATDYAKELSFSFYP